MDEENECVDVPDSFRSAKNYEKNIIQNLEITPESPMHECEPPKELFDYFFSLQSEIEKVGGMNYRKYAKKMWQKLVPDISDESNGFYEFQQCMIGGLYSIDMKEMVYPDLTETMPNLIEKYIDKIARISIWSTGDVSATGYQVAKINKSGITDNFLSSTNISMPKNERLDFIKNRTSYIVDDNKFNRLNEYVSQFEPKEQISKPMKIVIIEDTASNFEKAKTSLSDHIKDGKVEIIPIWFTNSREGINAEKSVKDLATDKTQYEVEKAKLEQKKSDLNSIKSFNELLDDSRFGGIFNNAHIMVDFDGVIADNITMRNKQAGVIYGAIIQGVMSETGLSKDIIEAKFLSILETQATKPFDLKKAS